jgi:hypothetical protein
MWKLSGLILLCLALVGCGVPATPFMAPTATGFGISPNIPTSVPLPTLEFPTPIFDATPQPSIINLQANVDMPKRGDTITVSWETSDATQVKIDIYDVDYFPGFGSNPPHTLFENLLPDGSLDIPIPVDYAGGGWQIHLKADNGAKSNSQRIDLLFADVPQYMVLKVDDFSVSVASAQHGDSLNIAWKTYPTARVSRGGVVYYEPVTGYDDRITLDIYPVYDGIAGVSESWAHFQDLRNTGSMTFTLPDYEAVYTRVMFDLGMDMNTGGRNIYDIRSVELSP